MPLCTEKQACASKYFNPLVLYRAAYMSSADSLAPEDEPGMARRSSQHEYITISSLTYSS